MVPVDSEVIIIIGGFLIWARNPEPESKKKWLVLSLECQAWGFISVRLLQICLCMGSICPLRVCVCTCVFLNLENERRSDIADEQSKRNVCIKAFIFRGTAWMFAG